MRSISLSNERWIGSRIFLTCAVCLTALSAGFYRGLTHPAKAEVAVVNTAGSALFRSDDRGERWVAIGSLPDVQGLVIDPRNGNIIYARGRAGAYKSVNGGAEWSKIGNGLSSGPVTNLVIDPNNGATLYATVLFSQTSTGIFKSTDGGDNWSRVGVNLMDLLIRDLVIDSGNPAALYAGSECAGVYKSSDGGMNWSRIESIATLFGSNLAAETRTANSLPLPVTLANISIKVRDGAGVERDAPLFFVSPTQINYQIPQGTLPNTTAILSVVRDNEPIAAKEIDVFKVAPAVFTADATGRGAAAGIAVRVKADGSQSFDAIARFDPVQNKVVSIPIDLGPESDQVFLSLFGTGWRFRSSESAVRVTIGGIEVPVAYVGSQPTLAGMDQINVRLPRSLAGKGEVDVVVTVDGKATQTVRINIK